MALFKKSDLLPFDASKRLAGRNALRHVAKADSDATFDIFLSHSHEDAELIAELYKQITEMGFTVYVDWIVDRTDQTLKVTPGSAAWVRLRMQHCATLLYATSRNSVDSKWMPWELGYFDGENGKVAILPIVEFDAYTDEYHGQEFLGIYPYVTKAITEGTQKETLWTRNNPTEYVNFKSWIEGYKPSART
jgi:hypothetical protein